MGCLASLELAVHTQRLSVILSHLDQPEYFFFKLGMILKIDPFLKKNVTQTITPVTGWISQDDIYAQICKLDSPSSVLPILLVEIE